MTQRLAGGVTAVLILLTAGTDSPGGTVTASVQADSPGCAGTPMASGPWARLAARVPSLPSCAAPGAAAGHAGDAIAPFTLGQSSLTALELNGRVILGLAPVLGQYATWIASDPNSPVAASCRKTVTPNPGALVLPNPHNGQVVLVCRNLPRP